MTLQQATIQVASLEAKNYISPGISLDEYENSSAQALHFTLTAVFTLQPSGSNDLQGTILLGKALPQLILLSSSKVTVNEFLKTPFIIINKTKSIYNGRKKPFSLPFRYFQNHTRKISLLNAHHKVNISATLVKLGKRI